MNTNTYEIASSLYPEPGHSASLEEDVELYSRIGWVFIESPLILIGRDIDGRGWHVQLAVGADCLRQFILRMPYYLPYVGWSRRGGRYRWRETERLMIKCGFSMEEVLKVKFGGGGAAKPPPPPKPPSPTEASANLRNREDEVRRKNAKGFQSTILTSGLGIPDNGAGKSLLGQ